MGKLRETQLANRISSPISRRVPSLIIRQITQKRPANFRWRAVISNGIVVYGDGVAASRLFINLVNAASTDNKPGPVRNRVSANRKYIPANS